MKKFVPLFLSTLLAFTGMNVSFVYAEGDEENGGEVEISDESQETPVDNSSLRILFTSDLQDHLLSSTVADGEETKTVGGYARLANVINMNRTDNTVLVDGGNFSTGTSFSTLNTTNAPDLTLLSAMGYDAVALGDEEFTFGTQSLSDMINVSENTSTVLTGNLSYNDTEAGKSLKTVLSTKGASSYKIVEKAGIKVGIFSVIDEDKINNDDVSLNDAKDTAKEIVAALQEEGASYIIAIAHGGSEFAHDIAKGVDGINTVIASCDVKENSEVESEDDVNIVSCGENGQYLGVLDIDPSDYSVSGYQLVEIRDDIEENGDIANRINDYKNTVNANVFDSYGLSFDETLASNSYNFTSVDHTTSELTNNNTADLITDAYASAYGDWYDEWYSEWKAKKKQMLAAAQSLADKESSAETTEESTEGSEEQIEGETTEESEATPTPTISTEASERIEEIQNMSPTVKKTAIGLISRKEIQGTFSKGTISAADAYNVVPNGTGSDGSSGESLVLVFLKGSDIRQLCEFDATEGRKNHTENQLYFSGVKYTYNDYRQDYNHVEEVYVDAVNDYYIPIHNDELYPVVTTLTLAKDLLNLSSMTNGKLSVKYYDENGGKILKLSANVLTYKNKEMKSYTAIASYMEEFERNADKVEEVPVSYASAKKTKTQDTEFTITGFFKNTTSYQLRMYIMYVVGFIGIVVVIKLIAYMISKRKEKEEEDDDE